MTSSAAPFSSDQIVNPARATIVMCAGPHRPCRVARGTTRLPTPGPAQLQARPEARELSGVGDARAPFERLPGPFEPDQPKVVQRGHAGVVDEQPQQVALGSM